MKEKYPTCEKHFCGDYIKALEVIAASSSDEWSRHIAVKALEGTLEIEEVTIDVEE